MTTSDPAAQPPKLFREQSKMAPIAFKVQAGVITMLVAGSGKFARPDRQGRKTTSPTEAIGRMVAKMVAGPDLGQ